MTNIDILILALHDDRPRAEAILDGLHEEKVAGPYRTRFVTEGPLDAGWSEAVRLAESCPCVILCWSDLSATEDAAPFRALGARVLAMKHAISVELTPGSLPAEMKGCSTYPLHGWHTGKKRLAAFVFGKAHLIQIAAAASRKANGQDPPPPKAFWRFIHLRAWAIILLMGAVLGAPSAISTLSNDPWLNRTLDSEGGSAFAAAKATHSCDVVRKFAAAHQGSPSGDDANKLLATCHKVERRKLVQEARDFPAFGLTEAAARADVARLCTGYQHNMPTEMHMTLISSELKDFVAGPSGQATAHCVYSLLAQETVEIMG